MYYLQCPGCVYLTGAKDFEMIRFVCVCVCFCFKPQPLCVKGLIVYKAFFHVHSFVWSAPNLYILKKRFYNFCYTLTAQLTQLT